MAKYRPMPKVNAGSLDFRLGHLTKCVDYFRSGKIPERIQFFMLVQPMNSVLVDLFGGRIRAVFWIALINLEWWAENLWWRARYWLDHHGIWRQEELHDRLET